MDAAEVCSVVDTAEVCSGRDAANVYRESKTGQMATSGEGARHRLHGQDAGQGAVGRRHLRSGEYIIIFIVMFLFQLFHPYGFVRVV